MATDYTLIYVVRSIFKITKAVSKSDITINEPLRGDVGQQNGMITMHR